MSGPTTALFSADPITVLLAAAAIRAAQAVAEGYAHAENLRDEQQAHRDHHLREIKSATSQGREALRQQVRDVEVEFEQLANLTKRYVAYEKVTATRPVRPDDENDLQLAAYARTLQALVRELRSILLTESVLRRDDVGQQGTLGGAIAEAALSDSKTTVQRLLESIAHLGEVPQEIARVAKEIADSPFADTERASLLTTELRMRIQKRVEAVRLQSVHEATALVLRQSLKDLGYQVEDIADTLFVEGGVVHFRRQGWGEYMVRMRVDAQASSANFNVIRAVDAAHNESSVLDHLAEDRWCAEFPALLNSLDVRGVHLNVTRRLEAGELPVQLVQKGKLPKFVDEEAGNRATKLISREIK